MLEFKDIDAVIGPNEPAEAGHRTGILPLDPCHFVSKIDGIDRDQDADHPPVTGGKIATSRACPIAASRPTKFWSTAARSRSGSAIASA